MAKYIKLKRRHHVGSRVFYEGDVADLEKWPELALQIEEDRLLKTKLTRAPRDKMVHGEDMKTK